MTGEKKIHGETSTVFETRTFIWNQNLNFMNSMSLKCAVELDIPNIIHSHGGSLPLSELVKALRLHPTKARYVYRLMRVLVLSGVFSQNSGSQNEQEVSYTLTPTSRLLCWGDQMGVKPILPIAFNPILKVPWEGLSRWFYSDCSTAFEMVNGKTFWGHMVGVQEFSKTFKEAMEFDSKLIANALVEKCKEGFRGLESLMDVGGGSGTIATAIAEAFPHIQCTVFDLPSVVANLNGRRNLDFVGGDMFEAIPPANAVLLKWIVHNWDDKKSIEILKNCKKAIPCKKEGGKVIIIDIVMNDEGEENDEFIEAQLYYDMFMMVNMNGAERSQKEWESLFFQAGFSGHKVVCKLGLRSVMEVYH